MPTQTPTPPAKTPNQAIDVAGQQGALLSAIEVGLGSLLHSFRIPFSGFFLSLNEAFILSRSALKLRPQLASRYIGATVANIAAILKSLSPAGKKLTPMLAISAQGLLFTLGTLIFGVNLLGIWIGCLLLSLWSFIQPVLIYYLLYGKTIIHVADYFFEKFQRVAAFEMQDLLIVLAVAVSIKLFLATLVSFAAVFLPETTVNKYLSKLLAAGKQKRKKLAKPVAEKPVTAKALLALKDLFNPLFILSLALTFSFFYFAHSSHSEMIWGLMRPIAVGFLLFFSIRALPFDRLLKRMEQTSLHKFADSMGNAVRTLKEI